MKTNLIKLCAVVLLAAQTIAFGQKTEIRVQKGKVIAETATQSVAIGAGRKAILAANEKPTVTVDNPLVSDALQLYKLIEAEKKHGDLKIDSAFILVGKADKEEILGALYFEFPNFGSEATSVLTLPHVSIIEDLKVYDLNGNLCSVDMKLMDETTASYSIHLSEQVQPGEHFKLIGVADLDEMPTFPGGAPAYGKEGPLWYFRTINGTPNCLNYFRFILPESAILVDSNREVVATDTVDGRVAVTIRNYTGEYADGLCMIALLWPDQDGTTLADIPDEYHGLRDPQEKEQAATYQRELAQILAGKRFEDRSTPLKTLLTVFSAAINKDRSLYLDSQYTIRPHQENERYLDQVRYWAVILDVLSIPRWPKNPGPGYVHPIYLCRKGSLICEFTQLFVHREGKWYAYETRDRGKSPVEAVNAEDIKKAKAEGYLADWEVAGPYMQKDKKHTELFDIPLGPELRDMDVRWRPMPIEPLGQHPAYLNLDKVLYGGDQMAAYLRTQIVSDEEKPAHLEIYTDDGVKAWLNGKLVHAINIGRGIPEKPDTVAVTLRKGTNHLMLKVTDDVWSWGAIVRLRPGKVD
ncbi:MAG: hypothetical protein ACETWQ_00170 [Phycisphaerae bacterium]